MQEHIRRAHPTYYIPKLPATEESFSLMVNTPLADRPQPPPPNPTVALPGQSISIPLSALDIGCLMLGKGQGQGIDPSTLYNHNHSLSPRDQRPSDLLRRPSFIPAANAAAVLAQLHNSRPEPEWESEQVHPRLLSPSPVLR